MKNRWLALGRFVHRHTSIFTAITTAQLSTGGVLIGLGVAAVDPLVVLFGLWVTATGFLTLGRGEQVLAHREEE